ncbi:MAG: hypothetical protein NTV14_04935 [Coprothermobacterota bacterium]|nr:hypothetical protein [Coprothermobacterota bacterium]
MSVFHIAPTGKLILGLFAVSSCMVSFYSVLLCNAHSSVLRNFAEANQAWRQRA